MSLFELLYQPDRWVKEVNSLITGFAQGFGIPALLVQAVLMVAVAAVLVNFAMVNVMAMTWVERKVAGHMQVRHGPMRTGFHGILQPIADGIKFFFKEPMTLPFVDQFIFNLSPAAIFGASVLLYIALPFAPGWVVAPMEYGLLFIFAVSGVSAFFVFAGAWSSNSKYSLLGAMRTAAQLISYEVPMLLAALSVALIAGSMNLVTIVEAQKNIWNWNIFIQPLGFLLFFTAALAELNRAPFDLLEAEQELVAGYITEFSGMRFGLIWMAEYMNMFAMCGLMTTLFLGGWQGPVLPPVFWFLGKTYALVIVMMWIRWTFPRIRVDHLMTFNWKFLLPLALINLAATAALVLAWQAWA